MRLLQQQLVLYKPYNVFYFVSFNLGAKLLQISRNRKLFDVYFEPWKHTMKKQSLLINF